VNAADDKILASEIDNTAQLDCTETTEIMLPQPDPLLAGILESCALGLVSVDPMLDKTVEQRLTVAKELCNHFATLQSFHPGSAGAWSWFNKRKFIKSLTERLADQNGTNQRQTPTCGTAALIHHLLSLFPQIYTDIAIKLFRHGAFPVKGKFYYASANLRGSPDIYDKWNIVDWMLIYTIAESYAYLGMRDLNPLLSQPPTDWKTEKIQTKPTKDFSGTYDLQNKHGGYEGFYEGVFDSLFLEDIKIGGKPYLEAAYGSTGPLQATRFYSEVMRAKWVKLKSINRMRAIPKSPHFQKIPEIQIGVADTDNSCVVGEALIRDGSPNACWTALTTNEMVSKNPLLKSMMKKMHFNPSVLKLLGAEAGQIQKLATGKLTAGSYIKNILINLQARVNDGAAVYLITNSQLIYDGETFWQQRHTSLKDSPELTVPQQKYAYIRQHGRGNHAVPLMPMQPVFFKKRLPDIVVWGENSTKVFKRPHDKKVEWLRLSIWTWTEQKFLDLPVEFHCSLDSDGKLYQIPSWEYFLMEWIVADDFFSDGLELVE
jgi:hypothetical protein